MTDSATAQVEATPTETQGEQPADTTPTNGAASSPKKIDDAMLDALVDLEIDGKIESIPLKELKKRGQIYSAADKRFKEAADLRKKMEQAIEYGRRDPGWFLKEVIGIDPEEYATLTLQEKIKLSQMTEEQRKLMEYEQELQKYKEREQY